MTSRASLQSRERSPAWSPPVARVAVRCCTSHAPCRRCSQPARRPSTPGCMHCCRGREGVHAERSVPHGCAPCRHHGRAAAGWGVVVAGSPRCQSETYGTLRPQIDARAQQIGAVGCASSPRCGGQGGVVHMREGAPPRPERPPGAALFPHRHITLCLSPWTAHYLWQHPPLLAPVGCVDWLVPSASHGEGERASKPAWGGPCRANHAAMQPARCPASWRPPHRPDGRHEAPQQQQRGAWVAQRPSHPPAVGLQPEPRPCRPPHPPARSSRLVRRCGDAIGEGGGG